MHHHALLFVTVQVSVSVYSILFQAALTSPFKMILLLYHTNLQLSENKISFLLTLAHRFQYISYLGTSISLFFQMSTRFCGNSFLNFGGNHEVIRTFFRFLNKKRRVSVVFCHFHSGDGGIRTFMSLTNRRFFGALFLKNQKVIIK